MKIVVPQFHDVQSVIPAKAGIFFLIFIRFRIKYGMTKVGWMKLRHYPDKVT